MERIALEKVLMNRRLYERNDRATVGFILHLVSRGGPLSRLLRFVCLTALTSRGMAEDDKAKIKAAIRDKYGFREAVSLEIMKALPLLPTLPALSRRAPGLLDLTWRHLSAGRKWEGIRTGPC